jgi:RNA polymerase sigma-70 factor (sigma-E family)
MGESDADREALAAHLFSTHANGLLRLAVLLAGDRGVGEELVQEAFLRFLRASDPIDPAAGYAYLRTSVVNLARSRWRRKLLELRHRSHTATEAMDVPDAAGKVDLMRALAGLSARRRACVVLRYYADLSVEETARVLGIAPGTVKSQTHKALSQLAEQLELAEPYWSVDRAAGEGGSTNG